jgi:hypothetical protein
VRTLVVSDLHLGSRLRHDVLVRPPALERLLVALRDVDRLVLLGDTVELIEGRPQRALSVAAPVLRAIGTALGREREVVVVGGNHDLPMMAPWVRAQGRALALDSAPPANATPELAAVVAALAPARVQVRYPGVWLADRVYATHGHYLDRHLLPESSFGLARGLLGRLPRDGADPIEYELAGGPRVTRLEAWITRWLPRPLAEIADDVFELARASSMPTREGLLPAWLAPVTSLVLGLQMRRASIPALARVLHRLGVDAELVLFGHVHRLGPLAGDDPGDWHGPAGSPRLANTGSWVYEPRLVHHAQPPHPYWPGGAILLEDGREPEVLSLLDDLTRWDLH